MIFENKRILITGGTGSLGRELTKRILSFKWGKPEKIIIFSRDEAKQHRMCLEYKHKNVAREGLIDKRSSDLLEFIIGDIRDPDSVASALRFVDIVINAAALKQVPTCEYLPMQAVYTNIVGANNIVNAISKYRLPVKTVVGISTDKACKPVNVMGMTKSIQERIFIGANSKNIKTKFVCVRYGNVLVSRGSVIPVFYDQIKSGGPVTITSKDMTRFLFTLDQAVDAIFYAIKEAKRGETCIVKAKSAKIIDIADVLIGNNRIKKQIVGIRPGEKLYEILISEEEIWRTTDAGKYYIIQPILQELRHEKIKKTTLRKEYSSADNLMCKREIYNLFKRNKLLVENAVDFNKWM